VAVNVEEIKIKYIPSEKSGQQLLTELVGVKKKMEEFEEAMASWVGKVNSNIEKTNQTLGEIREDNKEESEKLSEKLGTVDENIELMRKMHVEHMAWHEQNKSFLKKIFK